ncbi:hypothetical protein [Blastococcus xanthinilyticus]|uniref:Uncharacterized protein n=1 Tax=Blastococcus xanthinilyticus TaxID=1564164 RepID=A0A5S5CUY0_9ACTN|nr:hypothetical protein [Blastococcus xanthinilyticus]TYP86884.1 hypothetical protein BD833_108169 [Blastococcus xanthinilyticus]
MRRAVALAVAVFAGTLAVPAPAVAGPAADLCVPDEQRGTVPADFVLDACVDGGAVVLRNPLDVPVTVAASGDLASAEPIDLSEETAAGTMRLLGADAQVLAPGDVLRWPRGAGAAELVVAALEPVTAVRTVEGLEVFLAGAGGGPGVLSAQQLAAVATGIGPAVDEWAACTDGASVIGRVACDLRAADGVGSALAGQLPPGTVGAVADVALDPARWQQWTAPAGPEDDPRPADASATGPTGLTGQVRLVQQAAPPPPPPPPPPPVEPAAPPAAPRAVVAPPPPPAARAQAPAQAPAPAPAPAPVPAPAPAPAPPAPPPVVRDLRTEAERWLQELQDRWEREWQDRDHDRGTGNGWGRGGRWGD